jgi:2-haloalkanoic acid dehalogenase type II
MLPAVLTFDIFGTVLDWRAGLARDLANHDIALTPAAFEAILTEQDRLEHERFRSYSEITNLSLVHVLTLPDQVAEAIAANLGTWPLYPDSARALRRLLDHIPCVAMTNSDRVHGEQVQGQLGFRLTHWICAEEVRVYKPDPGFWHAVAARTGWTLDRSWWHVSAYADYDLSTARSLGLATVFVQRPHSRSGPADHTVSDLDGLANLVERVSCTPEGSS